jgi:dipeptidase E
MKKKSLSPGSDLRKEILKNRILFMKLLLTSDGLNDRKVIDFFVGQLDGFENKKACVVATRQSEEHQVYIDAARKELEGLGIAVDVANISEDVDASVLSEYDIYYGCGGNTFYILDRMRRTGMDQVLAKAIREGKFYVGVSAGSILVGSDIEISGWGAAGDPNDIGLQDLSGFGIVPYLVYPHYTEKDRDAVLSFGARRDGEPIVALTEEQALYVGDEGTFLIGEDGGLSLLRNGFFVEMAHA